MNRDDTLDELDAIAEQSDIHTPLVRNARKWKRGHGMPFNGKPKWRNQLRADKQLRKPKVTLPCTTIR